MHIEDLMTVYLKVVEAAAAGGKGADWGREYVWPARSLESALLMTSAGLLLRCNARSVSD